MMDSDLWVIIILPLLIFFARIMDVSIGTVRIILVAKGYKYLAPLLGFFEVLIWIIAISKIMENLDRWYYYLFYASGFAAGNFVGIILEDKIALGFVGVRIITKKPADQLIEKMTNFGYGVTIVPAEGSSGLVHVIFTTVKRKKLKELIIMIKEFNPKAFYTIEDIKKVSGAYGYPAGRTKRSSPVLFRRRGK